MTYSQVSCLWHNANKFSKDLYSMGWVWKLHGCTNGVSPDEVRKKDFMFLSELKYTSHRLRTIRATSVFKQEAGIGNGDKAVVSFFAGR